MYYTKNFFPYMESGSYMIMPAGLPDRFYPKEKSRIHETEDYVICFKPDTPEEIKQRFIKEYAEWYKKELELGHY